MIDEIRGTLDYERQSVVSVAAGIPFERLLRYFTKDAEVRPALFRVIPNIAIEVSSSMTFVASCNATPEQEKVVVDIFNQLGMAMLIKEELMMAGTALASSGIAFALRYIRAASEGGVELGFLSRSGQRDRTENGKRCRRFTAYSWLQSRNRNR